LEREGTTTAMEPPQLKGVRMVTYKARMTLSRNPVGHPSSNLLLLMWFALLDMQLSTILTVAAEAAVAMVAKIWQRVRQRCCWS
jgi:hypothetical protein